VPISLEKATETAKVVLAKKNIEHVQAEVIGVADISGSMASLYAGTVMQDAITRLLGVGMNIDINKSIDVYAFNSRAYHIGAANASNYSDFVKNVFLKKVTVDGGTNYEPVMKEVANVHRFEPLGFFGKFFGRKPKVTTVKRDRPALVFFITDGDNWDKDETRDLIRALSPQPIFWQFIGIGHESFPFLEELDTMQGRYVDNANFIQINDLSRISEEELYDRILNEFPSWLQEIKAKGMV